MYYGLYICTYLHILYITKEAVTVVIVDLERCCPERIVIYGAFLHYARGGVVATGRDKCQ